MSTTKIASYNPPSAVTEEEISVASNSNRNTDNRQSAPPTEAPRPAQAQPATPVVDVYQKQTEMMNCINLNSRSPVVLSFCPSCESTKVKTRTETKPNGVTWACVGAGVLIFWPLCWVPLVLDETKMTRHFCQNCGAKVGKVKPLR